MTALEAVPGGALKVSTPPLAGKQMRARESCAFVYIFTSAYLNTATAINANVPAERVKR